MCSRFCHHGDDQRGGDGAPLRMRNQRRIGIGAPPRLSPQVKNKWPDHPSETFDDRTVKSENGLSLWM